MRIMKMNEENTYLNLKLSTNIETQTKSQDAKNKNMKCANENAKK